VPRRFSRYRRGAAPSRRVEWHSTFLEFPKTTCPVGQDTFFAGYLSPMSTLQSSFTDPTLVRLRGQWTLGLQTASAMLNDGGLQVAVGVIPWKDINDTVPAAVDCPSPLLDGEFDWVWHQFVPVSGLEMAVAGTINIEGGAIDSKGMRRMPTGFGLLWVATVRLAATADSAVMAFCQAGGRMLYKE
jgi:hypothetical protein